MNYQTPIALAFLAFMTACGGDKPADDSGGAQPANTGSAAGSTTGHADGHADGHGAATSLGTVTVASNQFEIVRLGELVKGSEGALEVIPKSIAAPQWSDLNLYLWLESQDGTQVSESAKGDATEKGFHFHVTPGSDDKDAFRVMLRVRHGGGDERNSLPLDGHGHEHIEGPHHGVPATFAGGGQQGHLELKLHDDKGDLELWLNRDATLSQPFDLPIDSTIEIEFVDVSGKKVTLRARNKTTNEDEDGTANIRDGMSNYFIFPSQPGEDASWLQGKTFESIVIVRFRAAGKQLTSEEFVLKPHVH
ncbi:MAG: hypothetical protein ACI8UD_002210 [Planctomycetota bacterium]